MHTRSMVPPIFIGLDCGTSVIKAAAFNAEGSSLAHTEARFSTSSPAPGRMEFSHEALWQAVQQALRALTLRIDVAAVAAMGVTGAGNGLTLADANGRPLHPGVLAVDNRAEGLSDLSSVLRPMHGQCQWPGQTLQLLRWFADEEPELYARAAKLFVIKDFIKWQLTGKYLFDASEQSKLGLLDLENPTDRGRLASATGIPGLAGLLAPLADSWSVVGTLTEQAAAATGLPASVPVVNGLADIDASALGSGACRPGQLSLVAGTWSINQLFTDRPTRRPGIFGSSAHAVPGVWEDLEASASSTANLSWFVREACRDLATQATAEGVSVYELVNREVATLPPCSTPVFFHPYLFGSNTEPNARAGFYGLAGWQERRHLLAALFEGVVFSHALHVERLMAGGRVANQVFLSGGASRSPVWSQMFSDVLGLPLLIPAAPEVGALGAAMCAAVGHGTFPDLPTAVAAMARNARCHEPDEALHRRYAERFHIFKHITQQMKPVWATLERELSKT